jgi:imidazolonepropionase-like amidohydrolase
MPRIDNARRAAPWRTLGLALLALAAWALVATARAQSQRPIAIVGATVIHPDRDGAAALARDATIIISGARIQAVGPAHETPAPRDARIIDAAGKWVVPGLIDTHVHFFQSGNLYARPDIADFTDAMPYAKEVERNQARLPATLKVWLASGVTGVVDVGGPLWNFEVRQAARASAQAPRVAVAGPLVSTIPRPQLDLGDPPIVQVTSAERARTLVRSQLRFQPDYVKVWFIHQPGDDLAQQEEMVQAAAQTAHAAGVRVAVHATELAVAKAALRAGADFLVHSVGDVAVDAEFLQLAKARSVLYCPTLFVLMGYGYALSNTWRPTDAERRFADPQVVAALADLERMSRKQLPEDVAMLMQTRPAPRTWPAALNNLKRVHEAGITVVMGTDAGNIGTVHGPSVFRELALMAQAGLTPLEVLRTATVNGAKALGKVDELGVIAAGMLADLVLLDADPLADVGNLSKIHRVVKDGVEYDPDALIGSIR